MSLLLKKVSGEKADRVFWDENAGFVGVIFILNCLNYL
jgi:hypothetical protein